jgi:hypothetical protein
MTTKISITRALAELKLLDSRITKATQEIRFAVCVTKKSNYNINKNEFTAQTLAKHQSLMDLISRREKIKSAILKSNATTLVSIGSKEMAVIDAIEMKTTIKYKEHLLQVLKQQRLQVTQESEAHKARVKQAIDSNITQICSRDVKPDPATIQDLTDMMWKNDPIEVVDPINLEKSIESLTREIEDFKLNVDFSLSESNSLTFIEV